MRRFGLVLVCVVMLVLGSGVASADTVWREYPPNTSPENLNLTDALAGGSDILGVRVKSGTVTFTGTNSYTGGTEVTGGTFKAQSASPLGSNPVTVSNGATLMFVTNATITNGLTLKDGATLYSGAASVTANSSILLESGTSIMTADPGCALTLNQTTGSIAGDGGLMIRTDYNNPGAKFKFYGNNSYKGTTTITVVARADHGNEWPRVYAFHANAFGTEPNTVKVYGTWPGSEMPGLVLCAATGLNSNKSIEVGAYGYLVQGFGTTVSNTITCKDKAEFRFNDDSGAASAARYNNGSIILESGTTTFRLTSGGTPHWYQGQDSGGVLGGVISGDGGLLITSCQYANDTRVHFKGNNTYKGGTTLSNKPSFPSSNMNVNVGSDTALGIGPVVLDAGGATPSNVTMLTLDKSVTMANAFSGVGRIETGSYTLTTTGSVSPGLSVGTMRIDRLQFGSDEKGCTYNWEYSGLTTSDLISCPTALSFGSATDTLKVIWSGLPNPAIPGKFTLFDYGGADPATFPLWTVDTSQCVGQWGPMAGMVTLDKDANKVFLTLQDIPAVAEPGSLALLLLGLPLLTRRRRA